MVSINCRETVESDENGMAILKQSAQQPIFVYNSSTGEKIINYTVEDDKIIIEQPYTKILVDYYYNYDNGYEVISFGQSLTNGYFSLEGKTRVKDDTIDK